MYYFIIYSEAPRQIIEEGQTNSLNYLYNKHKQSAHVFSSKDKEKIIEFKLKYFQK